MELTENDMIGKWYSLTGKAEPSSPKDRNKTEAINFLKNNLFFFRSTHYSVRGTYYNGKWFLENGKIRLEFLSYNNVKKLGRFDNGNGQLVFSNEKTGKFPSSVKVHFPKIENESNESQWLPLVIN
eukprot:TRINITY_DN16760_c0_g1_i1.p1 TRINITY_DN16760_c0_g1~~TRINITY_DN16760_c0_g1_i1.p1  ORF type:complete len:126 (-),score=24.26 TRINITY_DN16760_c0_g1_i1:34-411(-)